MLYKSTKCPVQKTVKVTDSTVASYPCKQNNNIATDICVVWKLTFWSSKDSQNIQISCAGQ
jgi:hypothetical protein